MSEEQKQELLPCPFHDTHNTHVRICHTVNACDFVDGANAECYSCFSQGPFVSRDYGDAETELLYSIEELDAKAAELWNTRTNPSAQTIARLQGELEELKQESRDNEAVADERLEIAHRETAEAEQRATRAEALNGRLMEALKTAQTVLAMMIAPDAIKSTTVQHAWAHAIEAEAKARAALTATKTN